LGSGGGIINGWGAGGSAGGGAIKLVVSGTLMLDDGGQISANGANGQTGFGFADGGGSGGAIWIKAGHLVGGGSISANGGGDGGWGFGTDGGGGGGGRVSLDTPDLSGYTGSISAAGGPGYPAEVGGAGTVYGLTPDLRVSQSVSQPANVCQPLTYTLHITDATWAPAANVALTDTLSPILAFAGQSSAYTATLAGNTALLQLGTLPGHGAVTLQLSASMPPNTEAGTALVSSISLTTTTPEWYLSQNSSVLTTTAYVPPDTSPPSNPTSVAEAHGIASDTWTNQGIPSFTWSGAADANSCVAGYWVYWGPDQAADPLTSGSFQLGTTFATASPASGSTYYLMVKAQNPAGNVAPAAATLFTYRFDNIPPVPPVVTFP
jgi:uncharacterized repeat protein (TIGR01451 family)